VNNEVEVLKTTMLYEYTNTDQAELTSKSVVTWIFTKSKRALQPSICISSLDVCSKSVRIIPNKLHANSGLQKIVDQHKYGSLTKTLES